MVEIVFGLSYMRDKFDYDYVDKVKAYGYDSSSALKETITKKAIYLQDEWKFAKKWIIQNHQNLLIDMIINQRTHQIEVVIQ